MFTNPCSGSYFRACWMYCPEAHDKKCREGNSSILLKPQFFLCVCVEAQLCVPVWMSGNLRYCSLGAVYLFFFFFFFKRQGVLLAWWSQIWLGRLACKPQGSSSLCLPNTGLYVHAIMPSFLNVGSGTWPQSILIQLATYQQISPIPMITDCDFPP